MKKLKKLKIFLLAIFFSLSSTSFSEEINIASGEWSPYTGSKLSGGGFASKITTAAFAEVGIDVKYHYLSWSRSLDLAKEAKYDGTILWYSNAERKNVFYLSDSVLVNALHFFYLKKSRFDWNEISDLSPYKIGLTRSYLYGDELAKAEKESVINVERTTKEINNFKKILRERVDLTPSSLFVGQQLIKDNLDSMEARQIAAHPKPLMSQPMYFLVSKKHPKGEKIIHLFNEGLKLLKESGKYDKLIAQGID